MMSRSLIQRLKTPSFFNSIRSYSSTPIRYQAEVQKGAAIDLNSASRDEIMTNLHSIYAYLELEKLQNDPRFGSDDKAAIVLRRREISEETEKVYRLHNKMTENEGNLLDEKFRSLLSSDKVNELDRQFEDFMLKFGVQADLNLPAGFEESLKKADSTSGTANMAADFPFLRRTADDQSYSDQELYLRQLKMSRLNGFLGSAIHDVYNPEKDISSPKSVASTTVASLLAAGAHLGHSTYLNNPATIPFIHGVYDGIHMIDLNKTVTHLKRACTVMEGVAEKGGLILYIGTREGQKRALEAAAQRSRGYYVSTRWIPGSITNNSEINSIWARQEVDLLDVPTGKELTPSELKTVIKPDLIVILNSVENRNAINEATQARIPTIAIIDTDCDPTHVTYPIPANDDSLRTTNLIVGVLSKAAEVGVNNRIRQVKEYRASQSS